MLRRAPLSLTPRRATGKSPGTFRREKTSPVWATVLMQRELHDPLVTALNPDGLEPVSVFELRYEPPLVTAYQTSDSRPNSIRDFVHALRAEDDTPRWPRPDPVTKYANSVDLELDHITRLNPSVKLYATAAPNGSATQ